MSQDLVDRFFAEEYDDYVKDKLLTEIGTRSIGLHRLTFNVFDVVLDFDSRTVTIEDVLDPDSDESIGLADFEARLLHT